MNTNETTIQLINEKKNAEKGVTTVEYAVMLVGIAILVLAGTAPLKTAVIAVFAKFTGLLA